MKRLLLSFFLFAGLLGNAYGQLQINSFSPARNALNVANNATITANFNFNIDGTSLNHNNARVYGSQTGFYTAGAWTGGGTPNISFTPNYQFKKGETITVSFTTALVGTGGEVFATTQQYQFTARANVAGAAFASVVSYGTQNSPNSLCVADFDKDGDVDIVVNNAVSQSISFFRNSGSGVFTRTNITTSVTTTYIRAVDIDKDGDMDLVLANDATGANAIAVIKNNGDGTFAALNNFNAGSRPFGVVVGDWEGDGDFDVAMANWTGHNASVLTNNGTGTLGSHTTYTTNTGANGLAVGDVDSDGDLDLAVANYTASNISVMLNSGTGNFATKTDYPSGANPYSATLADIDGDSDLDILTPNFNANTISVFKNNGNGNFAEKADHTTGLTAAEVIPFDVDGDGDLDLATGSNGTNSFGLFLNNGTGSFTNQFFPLSGTSWYNTAADLDGDGDMDLVLTNSTNNSISFLRNVYPITVRQNTDFISASTGTFNFGFVTAGTTNTKTFTITNPDQTFAPFISSMVVNGANPTAFTTSNLSNTTIAANNGNVTFDISFSTSTAGNYSAFVTINNTSWPSVYTFTVFATAHRPIMQVLDPALALITSNTGTYNLGNVAVNTNLTKSLTIKNVGNSNLNLSSLQINGTAASGFSTVFTSGTAITPSNSVAFNLIFSTSVFGNYTAFITIGSNDPLQNPYTFTVFATAERPIMQVLDPALALITSNTGTYNLGNVAVNTNLTKVLTIKNVGNINLNLSSFQINGSGASGFSTVFTSGTAITPSNSVAFNLTFNTSVLGNYTAFITIGNNDPFQNPYTFTVFATAERPIMQVLDPALALITSNTGTHQHGTVLVNTNLTKALTIKNIGNLNLNLSSFQINGAGANAFSTTFTSGTAITPNNSVAFNLTFNTSVFGNYTAFITIGNNDPFQNPYTFTVFALAQIVPIIEVKQNATTLMSGTSIQPFVTVEVGSFSTITPFQINNIGTATVLLTGTPVIQQGGTHTSDFQIRQTFTSATIPVAGSSSFEIVFQPSSEGFKTAFVTIANNDATKNPFTFQLVGYGRAKASQPSPSFPPIITPVPLKFAIKLKVKALDQDSIRLAWQGNFKAVAYTIYRKKALDKTDKASKEDKFTILKENHKDSTLVDTDKLEPDTEYVYYVEGFTLTRSGISNRDSAFTYPKLAEVQLLKKVCAGTDGAILQAKNGKEYNWYSNEKDTIPVSLNGRTLQDSIWTTPVFRNDTTLYVTVKGKKFESKKKTAIRVLVKTLPIAKIQGSDKQFFCESVGTLKAEVLADPTSIYEWYLNGSIVGRGTELKASQSGDYRLIVRQEGCASQNPSTVSVQTNASPKINLPILARQQVCERTTLSINLDPNARYEWLRNGEVVATQQGTLLITVSGNYSVRATQNACTTVSHTVEIEVNQPAKIAINQNEKLLFCETGVLSATNQNQGNTEYEWRQLGVVISRNTNLNITESGFYELISKTGLCQTRQMFEATVLKPEKVVLTSEKTELCAEENAVLKASELPNAQYQWIRNGNILAEKTARLTAEESGDYQVKRTDSQGCQTVSTILKINKLAKTQPRLIVRKVDKKQQNTFQVYPNPSRGDLTIELSGTWVEGETELVLENTSPNAEIQWFLNGQMLSQHHNKDRIMATQLGKYRAFVKTAKGCIENTPEIEHKGDAGSNIGTNPVKISLIDYLGRTVATFERNMNSKKIELNLTDLNVGVFLLKVSIGSEQYIHKVLISK